MSKRNLYRIINDMREDGFPIAFDRRRGSYYYENEVVFVFKFSVLEENDLPKIKGGRNFEFFDNFFCSVPDSGTGRGFLCGR